MADNWDLADLESFVRALSIAYNGFYIFTVHEGLRYDRFQEFKNSLEGFALFYKQIKGVASDWTTSWYLHEYYFVSSMSDLILTLNASLQEEEKLKLRAIQIGSPGFIEVEGLPVPLDALVGLVPLIITRFFPKKHKKSMQSIEEEIKNKNLSAIV
jgi:hypothetical protein